MSDRIDFDPHIRALLEPGNSKHVSRLEFRQAIQAAIDVPEFSGITQWQRGWNDAMGSVKDAMAVALGIAKREG